MGTSLKLFFYAICEKWVKKIKKIKKIKIKKTKIADRLQNCCFLILDVEDYRSVWYLGGKTKSWKKKLKKKLKKKFDLKNLFKFNSILRNLVSY